MTTYRELHRRSIEDREGFWAEEAKRIHWQQPFAKVLDYARAPFAKWFVGGETNLCYNAVDRHLAARGEQKGAFRGSRPKWTRRSTSPTASCMPR